MSNFNSIIIDSSTEGNVLANIQLNRYLINNSYRRNDELMEYINMTRKGSVIFTTGEGRYNLLLIGGVHGNELASQLALVKLMDNIIKDNVKLKCTLHIIPFLIPYSTMINSRKYHDKDMNRNAHLDGITKKIVDYAEKNNITALCDCHSTDPDNRPGFESVFCSVRPLLESSKIAREICLDTGSKILPISEAGSILHGAVEDEANLRGIPAVTCETVSVNGKIDEKGVEFSYKQIISFLNYFGVI
jgi:predicted deacylase